MALINPWKYTKTIVDGEAILAATRNEYKVISKRLFTDKKGVLHEGYALTLSVLYDDADYGVNKNGEQRENNEGQNFDVTVLSRSCEVKKGDYIRLLDFDSEHSFAIGFDLILRFGGCEVLPGPTGGTSCVKGKQTD